MQQLNLHRDEIKRLVSALELAASRRESMDRAGVGHKRGSNHAAEAEAMRHLRARLQHALAENPRERDFALAPRP